MTNDERRARIKGAIQWTAADIDPESVVETVMTAVTNPGHGFKLLSPNLPKPTDKVTVRCAFCRWYTRTNARDMRSVYHAHMLLKHPEHKP